MQNYIARRPTIFVLGDSQVGKTTIVTRIFENRNIHFVSETDEVTEYHIYLPGREFPVRVLEIRNPVFLTENDFEVDDQRDVVLYCYAINDPLSFQHVDDLWIPLFQDRVSHSVGSVTLIANKKDLENNTNVVNGLADTGLQPVSFQQASELFERHVNIRSFIEWGIDYFQYYEEINVMIDQI